MDMTKAKTSSGKAKHCCRIAEILFSIMRSLDNKPAEHLTGELERALLLSYCLLNEPVKRQFFVNILI